MTEGYERLRLLGLTKPLPRHAPTARERALFRQGLEDARAGVTPSPYQADAYRRARILAVDLLGQSLVFKP